MAPKLSHDILVARNQALIISRPPIAGSQLLLGNIYAGQLVVEEAMAGLFLLLKDAVTIGNELYNVVAWWWKQGDKTHEVSLMEETRLYEHHICVLSD